MLGGVIQGLVKQAILNTVNFELAIDPIISKLQESCPPREEINNILNQKNQIAQALTQVQTSLTTVTDTSSTLDNILSGLNTAVTVIKLLPIPSSVPPGVGIPLNVINGFSDTLDTLGILLKEGEGVVSQVSPAVGVIANSISSIQNKLNQLDTLVIACLETETEGLSDNEKEEFYNNLGINLNATENNSNPEVNEIEGQVLNDSLNANSNNPFVYKNFRFVLDSDKENKFSFPRRRIIAENINTNQKLKGSFSASSTTQILINEMKFKVDNLNKTV